ncbi:CoA pyrophosphatase [Hyunsoonleella sp. SJ7]|uniref:CoA pyrophosphatase n=2 Tax=Hyunsoonleella aquatilis TaxID=2762758 RepID=A0A923HCL9_9FLAO|nr:CoA pyrophosphatase [Hyunsoonleella aquatilis]MBC3757618.1 CoA pyrophosphatase [Hyunsoonleella aquatilis]
MDFDDFLKLLSKIKNIPLPAETSHFKMMPPFRRELMKRQEKAIKSAKQAGVMALFYPKDDNKTHFILILRNTYKGVHSAQVSFPGGKLEKGDKSLEYTAVRETFEEVGVPEKDIEVIKPISQVYIPPSNFYVQPFIGISKNRPKFIKEEAEVEQLIEVELTDLLNASSLAMKRVTASYKIDIEVPAFKLNGFTVWGATAMMLSEIKDLLQSYE